MKTYGHLKVYSIKLTVQTPLFIGSGVQISKQDYWLDGKQVSILNLERFLDFLAANDKLLESYIDFRKKNEQPLRNFCQENQIGWENLKPYVIYTVDTAHVFPPDEPLTGIHTFIRDSQQHPYFPGSTLKGALVTAILVHLLEKEENRQIAQTIWQDILKNPTGANARNFHKTPSYSDNLREWANRLVVKLLHRENNSKAEYSLMRGISISDSLPIDAQNMILAGKFDVLPNGKEHQLNLVRECVKPGTSIYMSLTIDESLSTEKNAQDNQQSLREWSGIDADLLQAAIAGFGPYYQKMYNERFNYRDAVWPPIDNCLVIGGGSGYFPKNTVYPSFEYDMALKLVSRYMAEAFTAKNKAGSDAHQHSKDIDAFGISPHTMKFTDYAGQKYPIGICRVEIE